MKMFLTRAAHGFRSTTMAGRVVAIFACALPMLVGCKTTTFEDSLNGIKVTDRRWIMSTSADVTFEATTNGTFRVYVKTRSGTDVEAIEAAARGTAQGLTK